MQLNAPLTSDPSPKGRENTGAKKIFLKEHSRDYSLPLGGRDRDGAFRRAMMLLLSLFTFHFSQAQSISLESCYASAAEHYPTAVQTTLYQQIAEQQQKNLGAAFNPQLQLNGTASYQSPVVTVPIKIPGVEIPEQNHDQYKVTLDAGQLIYDGGVTKQSQTILQTNSQLQQQQVQVDLYKVRDLVLQSYFSVLLLDQQKQILLAQKNTFSKKLEQVNAGIQYGTVLKSQADILNAQLLTLEQSLAENSSNREAAIQMLNLLTGNNYNSSTILTEPEEKIISDNTIARPELNLFSLQKKNLSLQTGLSHDKRMPKLSAYGQAGYGRPGYNLFDNTFQPFFAVGVKLNWNILGWNVANREGQVNDLNSQIVQSNQSAFELKTKLEATQQQNDIEKFKKLLELDKQLVDLRKSVASTVETQFQEGTATATDFVTEQNNSAQAELNQKIHQLQLLQAEMKLKNILGI